MSAITTVAAGERFLFNPKTPGYNSNPYPMYLRLREEDPIHKSPLGVWFVGLYDHVRGILRDPRFSVQNIPQQLRDKSSLFRSRKMSATQPDNLDNLIAASEHWFAFLEPPDHTRLRGLVSKAFHQRSAESMRGFVRDCAKDLIDRVYARGEMDLMKDFACLLPLNVIATLLGVPRQDFPLLVGWTTRMGRIFDPLCSLEVYADMDAAAIEFMAYLRNLVRVRAADPRDDLLSALIAAHEQDDRLTEDEIVSTCIVIFGAGEETMVNLIGNGTRVLLTQPEHLAFLKSSPEIMPKAVEELLRYDAPLQMTSRTALEDVEVGGKTFRKGDQLYLALGSANRDPRRFEDPDTVDLVREDNRHMSFADGRHLCVGAQLARVEAQEAFSVMFEMLPNLSLATDQFHWREHIVLRGMTTLPVRF